MTISSSPIFSRDEMIKAFNWEHCGRTPAQYDLKKFQFVQSSHLRAKTDEELAALTKPKMKADLNIENEAQFVAAIGTVKTRATTLVEAADMSDFYFRDVIFDEKAAQKFLVPAAEPILREFHAHLAAQPAFDRVTLEAATTAWLEQKGLKIKDVAQAARVSLSGKSQSPGLYEVLEVLGRELSLARLETGAKTAAANTGTAA